MGDRLTLALRPWTYSEIGVLWAALLGLMALCIALQSYGRARLAHGLMAAAGAGLTGRLAWHLASHYARCAACGVAFDLVPNASSWAFFYDYLCVVAILAMFAWQESRRFALPAPARTVAAMVVAPLVTGPLFFAKLHDLEAQEAPPAASPPSWRRPYVAMAVLAAPFVMPALPFDHFGALGGEFFWDGTSNRLNSYIGLSVLLLFGQVFLFTLPRTRGFAWQVASLFLAFNNLAAYLALFAARFDSRHEVSPARPPLRFASRGAGAMIAAVLAGNAVAALFGVALRYTHFIIKAPETVCAEGRVTRARALPLCVTALEGVSAAREARARAPGANALDRALPGETAVALSYARQAVIALGEGDTREAGVLTRRLGEQHGSDLPVCQEAASANYAVLNECPE